MGTKVLSPHVGVASYTLSGSMDLFVPKSQVGRDQDITGAFGVSLVCVNMEKMSPPEFRVYLDAAFGGWYCIWDENDFKYYFHWRGDPADPWSITESPPPWLFWVYTFQSFGPMGGGWSGLYDTYISAEVEFTFPVREYKEYGLPDPSEDWRVLDLGHGETVEIEDDLPYPTSQGRGYLTKAITGKSVTSTVGSYSKTYPEAEEWDGLGSWNPPGTWFFGASGVNWDAGGMDPAHHSCESYQGADGNQHAVRLRMKWPDFNFNGWGEWRGARGAYLKLDGDTFKFSIDYPSVEGDGLGFWVQVAPHARFQFDLRKIGRGGLWSPVNNVRIQDNWLCYLQNKSYLTVSDGDELAVGDGSTPQLTGAVITGVGIAPGWEADWIVNPYITSGWKQVSGPEWFRIVPEWSWEAGEDVYDTTLVIEDEEDSWDALSVSHLATIDLDDRVGLLDPNNWSVTSGTATPSQGPNNALDLEVTSATATLTFTNFPSLTGVWGDPPFWTISEILPFEHWRFFDFIPLYREDPSDPWESGLEVGKVELEMAGIWWEVGSNHLTGSDHEQWLTTLDNWRLTWTSSRELYAAANVGGGLHEVVDLGWAVEGTTWQVRTVQEITLHLEQGYYRIEEARLRFLNRMDEHELLVPFLKRNTNDEGVFVDVSLADGKQSIARMPYFVYSIGAQSGIRVVSMMSLEQIKSGFNEGIWGTVEGTAFPGSYAGWEYKTGTTESWGYTATAADHPNLGLSQAEIDSLHEAGVNLPEEFYTKARWGVWARHGQGPGSLYQPNGAKIIEAWPRVHTFGASGHRMGTASTFHELTVRKFFSGAGHGLVPPDLIELEDAESALYPIRVDNQP